MKNKRDLIVMILAVMVIIILFHYMKIVAYQDHIIAVEGS